MMNRVTEVMQTVLPVFLMLVTGMVLRSRNIISREGINALKKVVVNISLPAVLLGAFATSSYSVMDIVVPLLMFLICCMAWGMGLVSAKLFNMKSGFVPFLTTGFEAGMLGYALFNMLYGTEKTADFARIDLGQVLFVFTLYKILLGRNFGDKKPAKLLIKEMLLSPIIIAIFAGVLIGATGLYKALIPSGLNGVFTACTDFFSAPTSAIILLTIGYDLVFSDIPWIPALKAVMLRFVIMLLMRCLLVAVLDIIWKDSGLTQAVNLMFILPPPFVLPVFADDEKQRVYVSSVLSLSTLAAIIGFAVLAAWHPL